MPASAAMCPLRRRPPIDKQDQKRQRSPDRGEEPVMRGIVALRPGLREGEGRRGRGHRAEWEFDGDLAPKD